MANNIYITEAFNALNKMSRMHDSKKSFKESKGRRLHEEVDNFDEDELRFFIEDMLSDNVEDNIAIVAASEVPGYNADWCNDDAFSLVSKKFAQCRNAYVSALVDLLTVYR